MVRGAVLLKGVERQLARRLALAAVERAVQRAQEPGGREPGGPWDRGGMIAGVCVPRSVAVKACFGLEQAGRLRS